MYKCHGHSYRFYVCTERRDKKGRLKVERVRISLFYDDYEQMIKTVIPFCAKRAPVEPTIERL
ncbi:MAG: hypothetical protein ACI3YK_05545 [Eubacteriales bacterium]